VVATSDSEIDDEIEEFCIKHSYSLFRGSENDLLKRLSDLSVNYKHTLQVELYGDCPFIDPGIIDQLIEIYYAKNVEYVTNSIKTTFSPGMEASIFKPSLLFMADELIPANHPNREHVSICLKEAIQHYGLNYHNVEASGALFRPNYYFELDELDDFNFLNVILNAMFSRHGLRFSALDLIDYVDNNPNIITNDKIKRRWKEYREDI